jgi:hypothetical protein
MSMKLAGSSVIIDVYVVVVEALLVPALLGTLWIKCYIWGSDPPRKPVLIQFYEAKEPFSSHLSSGPNRLSQYIRVSYDQIFPSFSETRFKCNSRAKGISSSGPLTTATG